MVELAAWRQQSFRTERGPRLFKGLLGYCGVAAAATAILYWLLRSFTPSTVPFADGLTTSLFLTAQFMMSRKLVENWWFWIVGDVLVIGLYIYKHLYLTTGLYLVMLAMSVVALVEWQRAVKKRELVSVAWRDEDLRRRV